MRKAIYFLHRCGFKVNFVERRNSSMRFERFSKSSGNFDCKTEKGKNTLFYNMYNTNALNKLRRMSLINER